MVEDYAFRRREYVAEIRKSFDEDTNELGDSGNTEEETGSPILFLKLRFFLSICIFIAFLFCKLNDYDFYQWTPSEVMDMISENEFFTDFLEHIDEF